MTLFRHAPGTGLAPLCPCPSLEPTPTRPRLWAHMTTDAEEVMSGTSTALTSGHWLWMDGWMDRTDGGIGTHMDTTPVFLRPWLSTPSHCVEFLHTPSAQGKPLRRLMYSANTSSIVARLFAKDAFQAALGQAAGITTVFRLAAAQIEANVAKSFRRAARAIRLGKARDSDARLASLPPTHPTPPHCTVLHCTALHCTARPMESFLLVPSAFCAKDRVVLWWSPLGDAGDRSHTMGCRERQLDVTSGTQARQ